MSTLCLLPLALILDALLGEPRALWLRLPHPAVLMGRVVSTLDTRLNHGTARRLKGLLALALMVLGAWLLGWLLSLLGPLVELILAAILLAHRSLIDHLMAVVRGLRTSTGDGRRAVAMIVGRDTAAMDDPAIIRAAVESGAENFSDGLIAPAFWFLIAGLPGLLVYKITNTADSMIGHRTPRHEAFGWAAARFDDLLNLAPARLTALLIALTHGQLGQWAAIRDEARRHRSPNAGWPEAAMARAIGIALSGPRSYGGKMQDYPFVHPDGNRSPEAQSISDCARALWRVWAVLTGALALAAVVLG